MNPGIYDDLDEATYHGHRDSLSVSGAKRLLPPNCPARFKYELDNGGRPNKRQFDVGHAAHGLVLGIGMDVEIVQKTVKVKGQPDALVDATDYKTASAQEHRDAIYASGKVPLLASEWRDVQYMAEALAADPHAKDLFQKGTGRAELSLFWQDVDEPDVLRRARLDWLQGSAIPDYKTCESASPEAVKKAMASYGYHLQADWYREGVMQLELAEDPLFVLVFQEKSAPYLVNVVEPDVEALRIGRIKNEQAIRIYAECSRTNTWPGYSADVELISLPKWATYIEDAA